jgi:23S rRNA (uracil1939-C5)-methyltransferase
MLKPGETIPVTIDKPAAGGRMLARVDGQVVLVAGAIPGERVIARVDRVSKGVVFADTVTVDAPSPDRRQPFGDPLCGGSVYSHIVYSRQLEIKSQIIADAFKRIGRLALPAPVRVAGSPEDGYRMRARLHVRGSRLGFFREGTHDVCDARVSRQLLPATCDALDRLSAAMRSAGLEAIREIDLSENLDASDRVVYLDAAVAIDAAALGRLAAIDGFTGLASAFGVHGSAYVTDRLTLGDGASVAVRRHVLAFFQGNRHLLGHLVAHVVDQARADAEVVDLYAGVGLFAVSIAASRGVRVTAVEGDRYAAADLAANAAVAGGSIVAVHQSVEHFLERAGLRAGTIIVDPPRTGLSREALDGALRMNAPRLIYVSCDVATLARDARRMVDAGYTIDRADAFDLFPNTPHVETVVVFTRT